MNVTKINSMRGFGGTINNFASITVVYVLLLYFGKVSFAKKFFASSLLLSSV